MLRIKNTDEFKKAFEQIALFIDECNIHINENGFTINAFDNAQMLYIEYNLNSEGIEGELGSSIFGINIVEINKVLSKISSSDSISLELHTYELDLNVDGEYKRKYTFPLKELDEKELNVDLSKYPIKFEQKAKILKDIFSSSKLVADSIMFDCKEGKIYLKAEGMYGKYNTELSIGCGKEFQTKFSCSHLNNMVKSIDSETNVSISLSPQQPFYLSYNIGNNILKYFLAHMFV